MCANDGTTIARPPRQGSDLSGYVNEFGDEVQPEVIEDMQRFSQDPEAYFSRYHNQVDAPPEFSMGFRPRGGGAGHDNRDQVSDPAEFPTVLNAPQEQERMRQTHLDLQNYYNEERFRFRRENGDFLEAAGLSNETIGDIEDQFSEHFGAIEDFFNHEQQLDLSMFYGNFDAHREHARIQANAISAARVFQDLQRLQNAARAHIGKHGVGDQEDFARRFANNMKQIRDAHLDRQSTFNEDPHKGLENLKDTPASRKAMGQLPDDLQQDVKDHFNQVTQYHRDQDKDFRNKQGNWGNPGFIADRQEAFNDRIKQNQEAERLALQAASEASREFAARAATERKQEAAADRRRLQQLERMFPEIYGKGNGQTNGADRKTTAPDNNRKPEAAVADKSLFGGVRNADGNVKKPLGGGQRRNPEQTRRSNGEGKDQVPGQSSVRNKAPVNGKTPEQPKGLNPDRKPGGKPVRPNSNGQRNGRQNGNRPQRNDAGMRKVPTKSQGSPNAVKTGGAMTLTDNSKVRDTLAKVRAQQEKMREQAQRIAQQARQLGQNIQQRARRAVEEARKFPDRVRKAAQNAQNGFKQNGRQNENQLKNPVNAKGAQPIKPSAKANQSRSAENGQSSTQGRPNNPRRPQPARKAPETGGIRGGGGGGSAAPASQSAGRSNTPQPNGPKPPNGGGNGTTPKRPGGGTPSNSPRRPIKPGGGNTPGPRGQSSSGVGQKPSSSPTSPVPARAGGNGKRPIAPKTLTKPPNNISLPGSGNSGVKPTSNGSNMGPTPPKSTKPTPPAATQGDRKPTPATSAGGLKPPARPSAGVKPPKPPRKPGEGGIKPGGGGIKIGGDGGGRGGR